MNPRQKIDLAYVRLREIKSELFAKIFEFGKTGYPEGLDIKAEIFSLRKRFQAFNALLRERGEYDVEWRDAIWDKCANTGLDGMFFFFDCLMFTFDPRLMGAEKIQKWVSYPRQEEYIQWRWERVQNNEPGACEKSRDVGATWIACGFDLWFWLFTVNGSFLVGSYKELYVDGVDPKAIMPKMDIILENLDAWIKPNYTRNYMILKNNGTNSVGNGEATNRNFGRGGRVFLCEMDEFPVWPVAEQAKASVGKTCNIIFYVGTPAGNNTSHAKLMKTLPKERTFIFHWTQHPEYQEGRYECQPGCVIHPMGGKPHSKLYDHVCLTAYDNNPKDIAKELDVNRVAAGGTIFDAGLVERVMEALRKEETKPKLIHYQVDWVKPQNINTDKLDDPNELLRLKAKWPIRAYVVENGPLLVYEPPLSCRDEACLCKGTGLHTYVMGGDVSKGLPQGDFDCFPMLDITSGVVCAEHFGKSDPKITGEIGGRLAKWYDNAWCAVEANDQGFIVNDILDKLGLYLHVSRKENKIKGKMEDRLGIVLGVNKNAWIMKYLHPAVTTLGPEGFPLIYDPFYEFWNELTTFIASSPKVQTEQAPEKAKFGAAWDSHDDRILARQHMYHGAMERYGKIRGYINTERVNEALYKKRMRRVA